MRMSGSIRQGWHRSQRDFQVVDKVLTSCIGNTKCLFVESDLLIGVLEHVDRLTRRLGQLVKGIAAALEI